MKYSRGILKTFDSSPWFREQDFTNSLVAHDYRKAIQLALSMEQPGRLLSLFNDVNSSRTAASPHSDEDASSVTGHPAVDEVIRTLPGTDLARLIRYVRAWNASSRTSDVAQTVLYAIFKLRSMDDITKAFCEEAYEKVLAKSQDAELAPDDPRVEPDVLLLYLK